MMTRNRRNDVWAGAGAAAAGFLAALALLAWLALPPRHDRPRAVCAAPPLTTAASSAPAAPPLSAAALRAAVLRRHGVARHLQQYGPLTPDTTVIVVQVSRDAAALRRLVESLSRVRYIESVLLVFSHATYDSGLNEVADAVDFCRTMQLFYPQSLRPQRAGGRAAAVESKLHWWWTARYVFEGAGGAAGAAGAAAGGAPVLFLRQEHVAAPDALHMLRHATRALAAFPSAHVAALGRAPARHSAPDLLALDAWRPPYDVGLVVNRTAWSKIAALAARYCMYEDCSWSYSLLNVFAAFPGGQADMLACVAPRVLAWRGPRSPAWPRAFPARVRVLYAWSRHARATLGPGVGSRAAPAADCTRLRDQLFCLDPLIDIGDADYYFNETSIPDDENSSDDGAIIEQQKMETSTYN